MASTDFDSADSVHEVLALLGARLAARGFAFACVAAGGAAIAAANRLARTTSDVDVLCVRHPNHELSLAPMVLPPTVVECVSAVAEERGLAQGWFNSQMAGGYAAGLPRGFESRVVWRRYETLEVGFLDRRDLIALKLEAAVDHVLKLMPEQTPHPHRRHLEDLIALGASEHELREGADWVRSANVAPDLDQRLETVIHYVSTKSRGEQ